MNLVDDAPGVRHRQALKSPALELDAGLKVDLLDAPGGADAPASAEVTVEPDMGLVDAVYRQTQMASSATPADCY